ncbi:MAG TPA: hypothetical protein VKV05_12660 [Terriglobales bacterium]|nr:hypothetical protein [Terriglobales bacterium]
MKTSLRLLLLAALLLSTFVFADTVILRDGSSYTGQLQGTANNEISFTDNAGVQFKFPIADVQTLVFTPTADTITLRNGKMYSGHYTGTGPISFEGAEGISYRFPLSDIASVVFSRSSSAAPSKKVAGEALVVPEGTEFGVRTDETIDSEQASPGQLFPATITSGVLDSQGAVVIPRGSPAKLVVRNVTSGGVVHSPELALDLFSVTVNGKEYRVVTTNVDYSNRKGLGANRRTAEFGGGGAGIGALMGALFGGGKGAAIGAGTGAAGGLITQLFTRGKKIKVPAETELTFRLERTLVLKPQS